MQSFLETSVKRSRVECGFSGQAGRKRYTDRNVVLLNKNGTHKLA